MLNGGEIVLFSVLIIVFLFMGTMLLWSSKRKRSYQMRTAAFESIFENMTGGVIVVDRYGKFLMWNPAARKILGKGPVNAPPLKWTEYLGCYLPDQKTPYPPEKLPLIRAMQGEIVDGAEIFVRNDDIPSGAWVIVTSKPLRDGKGVLSGSVSVFSDITWRKRAELAVAESEEKFRKIASSAQDAIIMIDDEGKINYWNDAAVSIFGYLAKEVLGREMHLFLAPEPYRDAYAKAFKNFSGTGQGNVVGKTLVLEALRKGSPEAFPIELSVSSVRLGGSWHAIGIVRDITERRRVSEELSRLNLELEEKARNYKTLVANIPGAIYRCSCDENWTMDFLSDAIRGVTGYPSEDFIENRVRSYSSIICAEDGSMVRKKVMAGIEAKTPYEMEYRINHADGSVRWVYEKGQAAFDSAGGVLWLEGAIFDVTENKRIEEFLFQSESQQKAILNNIPDMAWLKDRESRFIAVNEPFGKACGKSPESLAGKTDFDIWPAEFAERYREDDCEVMKTGERKQYEEPLADVSGNTIWIETIKTPVYDEKGEVIGTTGIARDITERKRTEQSLAKLNDCFLSFGVDPNENIRRIVSLLGELLNASCAIYNLLQGGKICAFADWHLPPDFVKQDTAEGHICLDVIRAGRDEPLIVEDLLRSSYANTDLNVRRYGLKTYIGRVVKCGGEAIGSVCVVYQNDFCPTENDKRLIGIIALAIGIEEERKKAERLSLEAKQQYQDLVTNLPVGVYRNTPGEAGCFLAANPAMLAIFEVDSKEAFLRGSVKMLYRNPEQRKIFSEKLLRLGAVKNEELELVTLKGNTIWCSITAVVEKDEKGQIYFDGIVQDITEWKQIEDALRGSEEKYRELVENANSIILRVDTKGNITFFNEFAQKFFGYEKGEILGQNIIGTLLPERNNQGEELAVAVREAMTRPDQWTMNGSENVKKNGERVWITWTNRLIYGPEGQLDEILCVGNDITELKKAEAELLAAHVFLNSIVENIPDMIFVKDARDLKFVRFNRAGEELLGFSRHEMIGKSDYDFFPREEADYFVSKDREVLGNGKMMDFFEENIDTRLKGRRILHTKKIPILNEAGERKYLLGISEDITDRKQADEAFRRQEAYFRSLIENALDVITVLDADGNVKYESPSLFRVLGYQPEELMGKNAFALIHPEDMAHVKEQLQKGLESPGVITMAEFRFRAKDGSWHMLEGIGENLLDNPAVNGIVVNCRDVTERKREQEALVQKSGELARANAEREQLELFAVLASHDLREPLQKILGLVDLLKTHTAGRLDEKGEDYLERVESASFRMNQLIGDLLQFSRAATSAKAFVPVSLGDVVREALLDLELQITKTKARVDVGDLPTVSGDKFQLRQLFQNLISNAVKFSKADTAPWVGIESRLLGDGRVEIRVKDNGIGFDEKYTDRIFKPFERLHSRSDYEGSGMGLAICQKIVLRHKGMIVAKSVPGTGATFIVTLPVR